MIRQKKDKYTCMWKGELLIRISKRGIGYYRLVSDKDDFYVSVKHGEKGYEDDEHIHKVAMMLCDYLNDSAAKEYPIEKREYDTKIKDEPYYYANDGLSPIGALYRFPTGNI